MGDPIDVSSETTAAFIGRALRGPLNTPILVHNFAGFRRRFGSHWHRSSLGPAVKQFFDHGGRQLYIVRVANNARGAMLCLPAHGGFLILRARSVMVPGGEVISIGHKKVAIVYRNVRIDWHMRPAPLHYAHRYLTNNRGDRFCQIQTAVASR